MNGVEILFVAKICLIWNTEAIGKYISMLTGLKNGIFMIWIDGIDGMISGQ